MKNPSNTTQNLDVICNIIYLKNYASGYKEQNLNLVVFINSDRFMPLVENSMFVLIPIFNDFWRHGKEKRKTIKRKIRKQILHQKYFCMVVTENTPF